MAQYIHKIMGWGIMGLFLTLTSLDLNTHLHRINISVRTDRVEEKPAQVAMATSESAVHKIRHAISE